MNRLFIYIRDVREGAPSVSYICKGGFEKLDENPATCDV